MATRSLHEQIANATDRLAKLKAKEMVAEQRAKAKEKAEKRRMDSHRKIVLGGAVIAAGADCMDEAEIVGVLLTYQQRMNKPDDAPKRDQLRSIGRAHLAARKANRPPSKG
ncbi:MAG: conjugal transfer protein TraD [Pseudomonas sp.]